MAKPHDIHWRGEEVSRVVLGTAQLGMVYGIANVRGKPSVQEAVSIVEVAWSLGTRFFDTAQAYGDSEDVLGLALRELEAGAQVGVISKLSPDLSPSDTPSLKRAIGESCGRIGVPRLWAMMLHRPEWLQKWPSGLGEALFRAKADRLTKYLGVSVYSVEDAHEALEHPGVDVIQVPCNAWDQRMREAGVFRLARRLGKLCFVRSVFLQGLLLLSPEAAESRLPGAGAAAGRWQTLSQRYDILPAELAVRFALSLGTPLVIGAETPAQARANDRLSRLPPLAEEDSDRLRDELAPLLSVEICDPTRWPTGASGRVAGRC